MASLSIKSASAGRLEIVTFSCDLGSLKEQPLNNNILNNNRKRVEKTDLHFDMAYNSPKVKILSILYHIWTEGQKDFKT